jgi:predicted aldo/keto reductase-like oxidoreductase
MLNRRRFLQTGLLAGSTLAARSFGLRIPADAQVRKASDTVVLGPDKIKLSRLAIGMGTKGGSVQRELGVQGLADLLHFGYDQGLHWWDTADAYKTHPSAREALTRVPREKVTIQTKTRARTAAQMKADLDRFRQELNTDYLDILLLHACMKPDWPEERKGAMEVLAEAREKGIVRTHGISAHTLPALRTSAKTPWVRVQLARINPAGMQMDADPKTVIEVLDQMKAAGKGVMGMKILGEGGLRDRVDEALRFALSLHCVDCFTIGPANREELADLIKRIPSASLAQAQAA